MELVPTPGFGFLPLNISNTIEDIFQVKLNLLVKPLYLYIFIHQDYLIAANLTAVNVPPDIRDEIKVNN